MQKVIKIYDPKDYPYGILSNNAEHYIEIDREKWRSVTNYIYGNMMPVPMYRKIIQTTDPTEVVKEYLTYYVKMINNIISRSLDEAYTAKVDDKDFINTLLQTGNANLVYKDPDKTLGSGLEEDGSVSKKGDNLVGMYLTQIRHRIIILKYKEEIERIKNYHDDNIYSAYIAYKILTDKDINVDEYNGLKIDAIIERRGIENLTIPDKEAVIQLYNNNRLENLRVKIGDEIEVSKLYDLAIDHPKLLFLSAKAKKLRKKWISQDRNVKKAIFEGYMYYILEKNYPNLPKSDYGLAIKQQTQSKSMVELDKLYEKLKDLYDDKEKLDEYVMTQIKSNLEAIDMISEREVLEAEEKLEEYILRKIGEWQSKEQPSIDYEKSDEIIYITDSDEKYKVLLPQFYSNVKLGNITFPTIMHYVYYNLFNNLSSGKNVYKEYIEVTPSLSDLSSIYKKVKNDTYSKKVKEYARIGLEKKFENKSLKNVLTATNNSELLYDMEGVVYPEPELGTPENYVGMYLEKLRDKYMLESQWMYKITNKNVDDIISKDPFLLRWVEMRISDMCNTLHIMKNHRQDSKLNFLFVKTIVENIYQSCSEVVETIKELKDVKEFPYYFVKIVSRCSTLKRLFTLKDGKITMDNDTTKLVLYLWKFIITMIFHLSNNIKDTSIQNALIKIKEIVSKDAKCVKIVSDERENCITSALINISEGVSKFDYDMGNDEVISDRTVRTAMFILLNKARLESWKKEEKKVVKKVIEKKVEGFDISMFQDILRKQEGYVVEEESEEELDLPRIYAEEEEEEGGFIDISLEEAYGIEEDILDFPEEEYEMYEDVPEEEYEEILGVPVVDVKERKTKFEHIREEIRNPLDSLNPTDKDSIRSYLIENVKNTKKSDLDKVVKTIVKSVETIKDDKDLKMNRINFYATMRD